MFIVSQIINKHNHNKLEPDNVFVSVLKFLYLRNRVTCKK
jgi:hypothetical protein